MPNGTPLVIGHFAKLAGPVIANLPREMDSQLALEFAGNGDALEIILAEALTRTNLDRALIMLGKKSEPKQAQSILKFIAAITIAARTTQFVPKKSYVVNTEPGSHVKIGYINSDFTAWFGDTAEEPTAETTLRRYVLKRQSVFAPAMQEVRDSGFVTKTTPGELYFLLEKQPDGPKSAAGPLLTNGYANLFEMVDVNGIPRLVYLIWYGDSVGWSVIAGDASRSDRWVVGFQLFSRNSR
jgi:hypothetical protein